MQTTVAQSNDGFTALRVKLVVQETADAVSLVFDVPPCSHEVFRYQAGQYMTLRVQVDGQEHRRCYSMSSAPALEPDLRITVKRDRDGVVSNWINDSVTVGTELLAAPPEGRFVLTDADRDVVAFAGGSGITPVFSLVRSALADGARAVRLFYANRSADSVIFKDRLAQLADRHADRFTVQHHLDDRDGPLSAHAIATVVDRSGDADFYLCGPAPFMDAVEKVLRDKGIPKQRVHCERFVVATSAPPTTSEATTSEVTIELDRSTTTVPYRAGNTLLQTARLAGLKAPYSCETGSCGTCMAQVVEGSAKMVNNDALDEDEVADGWVVTCQALPTSPTIRVVYE
jgi:3-ketosteroid 9alpha-monooxygenase subunit B